MPSDRPTKTRINRPKEAGNAEPRLPLVNATIRISFDLPEWDYQPPALSKDRVEYRAARSLAKVILATQPPLLESTPGLLTLDVETLCDPNLEEGFPSAYAPELAHQINRALPAIFQAGDKPYQIPPKAFPELGEVKITARFMPAHEEVAVAADSSHIGGQKPTPDPELEVKEEPNKSSLREPHQEPVPLDTARLQFIGDLLATVSPDAPYDEQAHQLEGLKHNFSQKLLDRTAKAIKDEMRKRNNDTYADKLGSTRWLTGELQRFNLAIKSPKVGGFVTLSADPAGRGGGGRFKVKAKSEKEAEIASNFNPLTVDELLANLEIIEAPPRQEGLRGRVKARNERSGPSRA